MVWRVGEGGVGCVMCADLVQNETDPLLAQVFVYDFVNQQNLGW
jgi:hypothetical protein